MEVDSRLFVRLCFTGLVIEIDPILFRLKSVQEFLWNGYDDDLGRLFVEKRPYLFNDCPCALDFSLVGNGNLRNGRDFTRQEDPLQDRVRSQLTMERAVGVEARE